MDPERLVRLLSKFDVHNFPVRGQVSHILHNIYLSDIAFGQDVKKIADQKFKMVINISEVPTPDYIANQMIESGIEYSHFEVDTDDPNTVLTDAMRQSLIHFQAVGGKTLFHCSAGCSRSAAVVIYILCKYYGLSMESACDLIVKQRPCVSPMPNYLVQVHDLLAMERD
uniref:Dual-specificity protein phosphatase n=1 Tax=Clandestinovirus TaxID=2831644 RepID=A0A8F8KKK1_9VIRU|nr:dual-specificity protein phosphatase [Clandestinovirus]